MAHEIMVIDPNNRDEKVTYRVAQPGGPECKERLEGWNLGRAQFQNQHCYKNREHAIGERA